MGRDKAFLQVEWQGNSVPLWDRQLSILKAVAPAELVVSGPRKPGKCVPADECRVEGRAVAAVDAVSRGPSRRRRGRVLAYRERARPHQGTAEVGME